MSEVHVIKTTQGWIPADEESQEVHKRQKLGATCSADFKQMRNYRFLRKYFALLNLCFDYWDTGEAEWKGHKVLKNFERFREDVQILAGYGEPVWAINGELRMRSKSISFGKMDESEFVKLYDAVITVLLDRVMKAKGFSREAIDSTVNQICEFM
jgi:hypothetical protein